MKLSVACTTCTQTTNSLFLTVPFSTGLSVENMTFGRNIPTTKTYDGVAKMLHNKESTKNTQITLLVIAVCIGALTFTVFLTRWDN